jgi:hypothetical protein
MGQPGALGLNTTQHITGSKRAHSASSLAYVSCSLVTHLQQAVKQLRLLLRRQRLSCEAPVKLRWWRFECDLQVRCAVRCNHATDG